MRSPSSHVSWLHRPEASAFRKVVRPSRAALGVAVLAAWGLLSACAAPRSAAVPAAAPALARELVLYNWEGDMPAPIIQGFQEEYHVTVRYETYLSQEDAIAQLKAGGTYDVVVMESRFIPLLAEAGLLKPIDYAHVPNFRNISPSFRNLAYDPQNRYSLPYNWGTTGLVVRTDLVAGPVTRWADLWDARYAGRVAIWQGQVREVIGLALKSLGYSANSEKPDEVRAALARLLELKPHVRYVEDFSADNASEALASGQVAISMGYAGDVLACRELGLPIQYVLPEEGAMLWGDTFVIPASSPNPYTAEVFLDYLLRPEVNARLADENHYATPNEAAWPLIKPEIYQDSAIFPPPDQLRQGEIILPLSAEGQKLYDEVWAQFLQGGSQGQP